MHPSLIAMASQQGGVFTRHQAEDVGYASSEIRSLTRERGSWIVVRRGVYAMRDIWESMDPRVEQWRARDWAAHLSMVKPHAMSHDSAARAWGFGLLRQPQPFVHISRPGVGGCRSEHGICHHLRRARPTDVQSVGGLPVTGMATTAVDIGCYHGLSAGLVAVDQALRSGVDRSEMHRVLGQMSHFPGVGDARLAVNLGDVGAESVGESMARLLVHELGIGDPITQFPVRLGNATAWCDLLVGRHVFEFDGKIKYLRREDGGLSDREAGEVVWDERSRQRLVCAEGLGMSRIIWDDFFGAARQAAKERLRAEWDVTVARFGTELPEQLAAYARQMAGRRIPTAHRLNHLARG